MYMAVFSWLPESCIALPVHFYWLQQLWPLLGWLHLVPAAFFGMHSLFLTLPVLWSSLQLRVHLHNFVHRPLRGFMQEIHTCFKLTGWVGIWNCTLLCGPILPLFWMSTKQYHMGNINSVTTSVCSLSALDHSCTCLYVCTFKAEHKTKNRRRCLSRTS